MSEFVNVDVFIPEIRIAAPRCPYPSQRRLILESIIELCQEASCWRYQHPPIDIVAGVKRYELDPPLIDTHVHSILSACTPNNQPLKVSVPRRGFVELADTPTADIAGGLNLLLSIKPNWDTDEVAATLFDDYRQTVIHGAKERLYDQGERPWGNPDLALKFRQLFQLGIARAKAAEDRGRMTGKPRMTVRRITRGA